MKSLAVLIVVFIAAGTLGGCGSSTPTPAPSGGNSGTATVQGLTTPKSVSVVTAN